MVWQVLSTILIQIDATLTYIVVVVVVDEYIWFPGLILKCPGLSRIQGTWWGISSYQCSSCRWWSVGGPSGASGIGRSQGLGSLSDPTTASPGWHRTWPPPTPHTRPHGSSCTMPQTGPWTNPSSPVHPLWPSRPRSIGLSISSWAGWMETSLPNLCCFWIPVLGYRPRRIWIHTSSTIIIVIKEYRAPKSISWKSYSTSLRNIHIKVNLDHLNQYKNSICTWTYRSGHRFDWNRLMCMAPTLTKGETHVHQMILDTRYPSHYFFD